MAVDELEQYVKAIGNLQISPNIPGLEVGDVVPKKVVYSISSLWVFFMETAPPALTYGAGVAFGLQGMIQASRSWRHIPPSSYDEELREGGILGFTGGALGGLFGGLSCGADIPHALSGSILGGLAGSLIGAYSAGLCKFIRP